MSLFSRIDQRTALMGRMMRTVGATDFEDTGLALERELRAAFFRCQACTTVETCRTWLDEHDHADATPGFCPNAQLFDGAIGEEASF